MEERNAHLPLPPEDLELPDCSEMLDPALLEAVEVESHQVDGRQREIAAKIQIPRTLDQVWKVLTDYEQLAEFIPNLVTSQRLEHPAGGVRIEQVGAQRLLRLNFSARVVLDMEEDFPHEIRFKMVEGDFKDFSGFWRLEPCSTSDGAQTKLCYVVRIWPKRLMPIALIERRLRQDVCVNLWAIRQQVCKLFGHR